MHFRQISEMKASNLDKGNCLAMTMEGIYIYIYEDFSIYDVRIKKIIYSLMTDVISQKCP